MSWFIFTPDPRTTPLHWYHPDDPGKRLTGRHGDRVWLPSSHKLLVHRPDWVSPVEKDAPDPSAVGDPSKLTNKVLYSMLCDIGITGYEKASKRKLLSMFPEGYWAKAETSDAIRDPSGYVVVDEDTQDDFRAIPDRTVIISTEGTDGE